VPYSAQDIVHTYKRVFLRGLATLLPTLLTLWIVTACYGFVTKWIAEPIADGLKTQMVSTELGNRITFAVWTNLAFLAQSKISPPPDELSEAERVRFERAEHDRIQAVEARRQEDLRQEIDARFPKWVGFVLAVVAVFVVGFFITSFLGTWSWGLMESWVVRIPLVKNIYPGAKQLVSFFLSGDQARSWQAVVAVEFPRQGLWSIGFLTSENIPEIEARCGEKVRGVYLGTPAAGQVVLAREAEIVAIDMTVDEALKFLMSGGVIGRDPNREPGVWLLPWQTEDPPPEAGTGETAREPSD